MRGWFAVLLQMGVLVAAASALGLGANALRRDGNRVELGRNYFPAPLARAQLPEPAGVGNESSADGKAPVSGEDGQATQPKKPPPEHGLQVVTFDEARALLDGEQYALGLCIFVDARDDEHYSEGHIPGAYQLDHYRRDVYLPELLPVALGVDRIVIYCNGGECEDSIFAAEDLMEEGVLHDNIYLYEGGMKEWRAKNGSIEAGEAP